MNSRFRVFAIIVFAIGLTFVGLYQTLFHKTPSPILTACWFPLGIIAKKVTGDEVMMITAALVQFPSIGFAFEAMSRRRGWNIAAIFILIGYTCSLLAAVVIVSSS